jgi:hypothetical protein
MAYTRKPDDEAAQQGAPAAGGGDTGSPQRIMSGYGAGAVGTGTAGQPQSSAPTPAQQQASSGPSATGYVNFERFFDANADAAKRSAGQVASTVGKSAETAKSDLGGVVSSFNQQAQAGTPSGPSTGDFRNASGMVTHNAKGGQSGSYGTTQPGASATSQDKQKWTAGAANAAKGYTGPTSLDVMSGYGAANDAKARAEDQLSATSSDAGLQGLLQAQSQPGGYSDQQSAFDAALAGAAGQGQFANERQQYGNLDKLFNDADTNAQNTVAQQQQLAQNAQTQYGMLGDQEAQTEAANTPAASGAITTPAVAPPGDPTTLGGEDPNGIYFFGQGNAGSPEAGSVAAKIGFNGQDPIDEQIYQQLTAEEWRSLNSMTADQAKAWWANKKKALGG